MKVRHPHNHKAQEEPKPVEDGNAAAEAPEAEAASFEEAHEQIRKDHEELQNQLLRTIADMQNMRKRFQQEAQQNRLFATEDLVRELLPVLDNFERTVLAADQGASVETVVEGIKAVDRQLRSALERRQVTRIKSHGEQFNPDLHEAIVTEETSEHPEGTVTLEIEPGYKMGEKVIRPARVRVSKKP